MSRVAVVVGLLQRPQFHQARAVLEVHVGRGESERGRLREGQVARGRYSRDLLLQFLHGQWPGKVPAPQCRPMMEFQWTEWLAELRKEHGGEMWAYQEPVAVFLGEQLLGGLAELLGWASEHYGYHDSRALSDYEAVARDAYNQHISNPERDFVFFDMCVEGDLIGRLVLELYRDLCPRTADNFVCLCTGERGTAEETGTRLSYVNSLIHRVVPGGWVQGGDICGGSGDGGLSIYGKIFEDECFAVPHSSSGVLGMANHGRNTNNSQFYITLSPAPWMDRQYVAFGRLVEGSKVLQRLASLETYNERPKERCQISNSGRLPLLT